jgi:hypothetical protein
MVIARFRGITRLFGAIHMNARPAARRLRDGPYPLAMEFG